MTIETRTALIHEHMYDQLNDSNYSNDGTKSNARPYKRKWTDKYDTDSTKKRQEYQKQKTRDNRCGQCGHRTCRDNTYDQQKWQNVETAEEEATAKRCADRQTEYNTLKEQHHRQKKTTGNTIEFRK